MNEPRTEALAAISETELLSMKSELTELRNENAELKSRAEKYAEAIQEQSQELEQLRRLARVVLNHFKDFLNTGCHVDRCVACGKCDYEVLGQALLPWKGLVE